MLTPSRPKKRRIAERAGGTAKAIPTATAAAASTATRARRRSRRLGAVRRARTPGQRSRSTGSSTEAARAWRSRSSSAIACLRQIGAQQFERPREPRLDRSTPDPEGGGGLFLGEVEEIPAGEDEPVVVAE